ncbi:GntR family transcriptional regulator [Octadecabacter sp. 1_MG-2023]|uniref:GntR family transcriptional regulator n=1 Tax=unclassified Octadecabacter TaxID=196158 RepID=UPI001C0A56D1|nr:MULTISPECIES: GntR family transcriptional regulator [unclassified Octadecabacter]MBU2993076.1 GntR family transcriptional regulator [Octadecabacter sp. B2R22]MDO6733472.1 GntR family transcriptional regulator [Octadecabacter sp. 1_MG-2023]
MTDRERPTALPKYVQISEMLVRDIAAGRLADGARLPPEREMADSLGIAVGTLRHALEVLEEKKLLERVQGSGNYVRARGDVPAIYRFLRIERKQGGGLPTAEVLSIDHMAAPSEASFQDPNGFRFRRLRFMDAVPAAMEEIWLDGAVTDHVDESAVSESLYHYYSSVLGVVITSAQDHINVDATPDWVDPRFGLSAGEMAGYIERIGRNHAGRIVEFSRTWFDPSEINYVSRLGKN